MSLDWIAVDWGTSRLRAWGIGRDGAPLWARASEDGMGSLAPDGFEPALNKLVGDDAPVPVVACGMVGARQGWVEAPYREVPARPLGPDLAQAPTTSRRPVFVIGGLRQSTPPDVMRGEETQIAGFLSLNPDFDGVLCLPGSHSKWARISAGEVVSFQTFLTGEMYAALKDHTVLRHTVGSEGWDASAFAEAVSDTLSRPERLAAGLFGLRAGALIADLAPSTSRARLSGLLIGAELAAARPYWLGQQVALIGAAELADTYATALALQGVPAIKADATAMVLKGLSAAHTSLRAKAAQ